MERKGKILRHSNCLEPIKVFVSRQNGAQFVANGC